MINGNKMLFSIILVFSQLNPAFASPVKVLPEPVSITQKEGVLRMNGQTRAWLTAKEFTTSAGKQIIISIQPVTGITSPEGYLLDVTRETITLKAPSKAGLFYGWQTLRQLQADQNIPCVRIMDYPRYAYRGMHLDVSRHFFSVAFIRHYLDMLAAFKINTFHWHLTDSHGWRLEIRQYPRLCTVGAWRADRTGIPMTIAEATKPGEPATYGGYYTQEQVREIVAYAADRYITVIPEIEMPGHCTAALVAYPQYADLDNPVPLQVPCGYPGDLQHNFCAGNDSTFIFLQHILQETMALFPSKWIHIGGDEVREGPWLGCSRCRQRMKEKGFSSVRQLQAWFTGRIDSFITASGRRMMGWDEVRNAGLAKGSTIMSWHGDPSGRDSAGVDHDVVMTPYRYAYFDFYQSDPRLEPDITYAPLFLDSVYAFDPGGKAHASGADGAQDLTGDGAHTPGDDGAHVLDDDGTHTPRADSAHTPGSHVLGGEACLWTENIPTPERVEYMLLPRLTALSEALWTPADRKDYGRFIKNLEAQFPRWDAEGIHYARSLYNPGIHPSFDSTTKEITVTLSSQVPDADVRYSLGGDYHTCNKPLRIHQTATLQTALFRGGHRLGKINSDSFVIHKAIGASGQLTDGIFGTVEPYDGRWVAFHDSVITVNIRLPQAQDIRSIGLDCLEDQVGDIYLPRTIRVQWSEDGYIYREAEIIHNETIPLKLLRHVEHYEKIIASKARYIRIELQNAQLWKAPEKNQIFVDEIVVQ